MVKTSIKKLLCGALVLTATLGCATTLTACETSHPEVEMQIEFNGTTYEFTYTLYRKIAPATVNHFLALAENGYYNGLCVHDYQTEKLYTGAYSYDNDTLVYKPYYELVKTYNLPQSVWMDSNKNTPTYTLYGEFAANEFQVQNGALEQTFGSLTMYYTPKTLVDDDRVYIQRHDGKGMSSRSYETNSATSQFFISLAETATTDGKYCTFATMDEDSIDELYDLKEAIEAYILDNYGSAEDADTEFAPSTTLDVDFDDAFVGVQGPEATYSVPQKPIVIKKVSVKKY